MGAPLSSRYAEPAFHSAYQTAAGADYLRGPPDMIEAQHALIEPLTDPYRMPELPMVGHQPYEHQPRRLARSSLPAADKVVRSSGKHSVAYGGEAARRSADYIGHGQYASSSVLNGVGFVDPKEDTLSGRYAAGYPPTKSSNDYTELELAGPQNGQASYLAGGPSAHRDAHLIAGAGGVVQQISRRKGPKSSYNRRYIADAHYESHEQDLMAHEIEREAMLVDMGPAQTEWFYELKLRGALIVRVLFTREANNDKDS